MTHAVWLMYNEVHNFHIWIKNILWNFIWNMQRYEDEVYLSSGGIKNALNRITNELVLIMSVRCPLTRPNDHEFRF